MFLSHLILLLQRSSGTDPTHLNCTQRLCALLIMRNRWIPGYVFITCTFVSSLLFSCNILISNSIQSGYVSMACLNNTVVFYNAHLLYDNIHMQYYIIMAYYFSKAFKGAHPIFQNSDFCFIQSIIIRCKSEISVEIINPFGWLYEGILYIAVPNILLCKLNRGYH